MKHRWTFRPLLANAMAAQHAAKKSSLHQKVSLKELLQSSMHLLLVARDRPQTRVEDVRFAFRVPLGLAWRVHVGRWCFGLRA